MILNFTIRGNQENPEGNPIPYERLLNHSWRASGQRYVKWQNYVQMEFISQFAGTKDAKIKHYLKEQEKEIEIIKDRIESRSRSIEMVKKQAEALKADAQQVRRRIEVIRDKM